MISSLSKKYDYLILFGVILLNLAVWSQTSRKLPEWANVPVAPSITTATATFLGDKELAYRSLALTLQSFGNLTGRVKALQDYNYDNLATWFWLSDGLNSKSNYVPFLASYYFSGSQDPSKLRPLIEYLRHVGKQPEPEKWRHLGQAVYLANHKLKDTQLALELADELALTYKPNTGMPAWPLQMKAIIASGIGEKEMAYNLLVDVIKNKKSDLDPAEINYMLDQICNNILTAEQKIKDPLCQIN
jgi:hypothetical protein